MKHLYLELKNQCLYYEPTGYDRDELYCLVEQELRDLELHRQGEWSELTDDQWDDLHQGVFTDLLETLEAE